MWYPLYHSTRKTQCLRRQKRKLETYLNAFINSNIKDFTPVVMLNEFLRKTRC